MKKITIVIETPRHCIGKYFFDPETNRFRLKKILPLGMSFPYDFGMIKGTVGEDGDPVDAVVISECDTYPGVEMECRVIGALLANQSSAGKKKIRNDRFIFIPVDSIVFDHIKNIKDFSREHNHQLQEFFINYNKVQDKAFVPLRWVDAPAAQKMLEKLLQ